VVADSGPANVGSRCCVRSTAKLQRLANLLHAIGNGAAKKRLMCCERWAAATELQRKRGGVANGWGCNYKGMAMFLQMSRMSSCDDLRQQRGYDRSLLMLQLCSNNTIFCYYSYDVLLL
jgi:hypothetical protein